MRKFMHMEGLKDVDDAYKVIEGLKKCRNLRYYAVNFRLNTADVRSDDGDILYDEDFIKAVEDAGFTLISIETLED